MTTDGVTVAAFDFDGTLTTRDSVVPFLERFVSRPRLAARVLARLGEAVPAVVGRDRDRLRALATELVFAGRPAADVAAAAGEHGRLIAAAALRTDTVARLRWHIDHGHVVVLVSASYEDYLHVVAAELGVGHVLGTRLEVADGVCTGSLDGPNCRGPEKVRRLERWLAEQGLDRGEIVLYAYGDSNGDREMLAWADHPHRVNEPLASVAPTV